ncbi:carboxypeptidase-like regulatory domain-containing protein [Candidatus Cloacimonadota bacterium]
MKKLLVIMAMFILATGLAFAAQIQGQVTDVETGEGIDQAFVRFYLYEDGGNGGCGGGNGGGNGQGPGGCGGNGGGNCTVYQAVTDANGNYSIPDVPEGVYVGKASKPGSHPCVTITDIEVEGTTVVDFELEPGDCGGFNLIRNSKNTNTLK